VLKLTLGLVFAGIAWSQNVTITDVITTGPMDHTFAPGASVYILGSFPSPAAGRDFTVTVGGQTGGINVADTTDFITAPIPINAPTGPTTLTVTWQGKTSNAFPLTILPLAPEIGGTGVSLLGPAAPDYNPYNPFLDPNTNQRITPSAAAAPGEPLSVVVYGLAQNTPPAVIPTVTVAGENAKVLQAVSPAAGAATVYFFVPSDAPLGVDPVVVTVAGVNSNTVGLPVGSGPAVNAVLNAASFALTRNVAPGSIVSVFGENFGTKDNLSAFPSTNVNGVSVLFGNTPAPIFALAAAEGQINVLVPTELGDLNNLTVTVQTPSGTSAAYSVFLASAAPGAFYYSDPLNTLRKNAVAVVANTAWIAMPLSMAANMGLPSNCSALAAAKLCGEPAHPGDYLQIYATGLGKATPNGDLAGSVLPTGQIAPVSGSPLYATIVTPTVTVGGLPATVVFSGIAPGYAGLYQLDIQIPAGVAPGDDVTLAISLPGSATDTTTIAITKP